MADMKKHNNQIPARNWFRITSTILKFIFFFSFVILLILIEKVLFASLSGNPEQLKVQHDVQSGTDCRTLLSDICSLPTARYNIYTGVTACYPSSGGIWIADLGPVELHHLNINRFQSSERSSNQVDEDRFCHKLRQFGGSWYNPESGVDLLSAGECCEVNEFMPIFSIIRQIGFAEEGGMWVLTASGEDERFPKAISAVQNALTRKERCMALERLGAVFCEDIKGCPALYDLSKEPYELAEEMGISPIGIRGPGDVSCRLYGYEPAEFQ